MENQTNTYESFNKMAEDSGVTATAQNILEKGTEAYGKAEQVVGEAYEKTTQKVKETYAKAKSYSDENPGKAVLVVLGLGVGMGMLLSATSSYRSRTGRIAEPVINALSDIAHEVFR